MWFHSLQPEVWPEVFTTGMPNAQGTPGFFWQLIDADVEYEGGDDLRVIIYFRRRPS